MAQSNIHEEIQGNTWKNIEERIQQESGRKGRDTHAGRREDKGGDFVLSGG